MSNETTTTVCRNGHLRTEENIYVRPNGKRQCRECRRLGHQRTRKRRSYIARPKPHQPRGIHNTVRILSERVKAGQALADALTASIRWLERIEGAYDPERAERADETLRDYRAALDAWNAKEG